MDVLYPDRPNPAVDQKKWYMFWQMQLIASYSATPKGPAVTDADAPDYVGVLNDARLHRMLLERKDVAFLQGELSRNHAKAIATGSSFEARWNALGLDGRKDELENALAKTATGFRNVESWWFFAPEMEKSHMCSGVGEQFANVVRHFLVADLVNLPSPDFPVLVNERVWAKWGIAIPGSEAADLPRPAAIRAFHDTIIIWRHYFLVVVCYYVLSSICDSGTTLQYREFDDSAPRSADEKALQSYARQSEPEGVKLHRCSSCQAIDRRMLYCSRICGKLLRTNGPVYTSPSAAQNPTAATLSAVHPSSSSSCSCHDGWFSPRMRYYLRVTAEVESDMIIACDFVCPKPGEPFHHEWIPVGSEIPIKCWPTSTVVDFTRFLHGLSFALAAYATVDLRLPTLFKFGEKLAQLEATQTGDFELQQGTLDDYKFVKKQGVTLLMILSGLVGAACEDVTCGEFKLTFGDEMLEMPLCTEHDEDFMAASLLLMTTRS
ncbi:hypothetical protein RQP46_003507 [Phenoliferia psychrophenolica]